MNPTPSLRAREVADMQDHCQQVGALAQESLHLIGSMASMLLLALERPDRQDHLANIAFMVRGIRDNAATGLSCVQSACDDAGVQSISQLDAKLLWPAGVDQHLKGVH